MKWTKECGARLRATRKEKGLTRGDLARKTGSDTANLSNMECGLASPHKSFWTVLADALGVSAPYLLCQTDDPKGGPSPTPHHKPEQEIELHVLGEGRIIDVETRRRRDLFAAAALTGLVARGRDSTEHAVSNTRLAWKYADAMLEDDK